MLASRPWARQGLWDGAQPQLSRQVARGVDVGLLRAWGCSSNALPGTTVGALLSYPLKPGVCASWLSARRPQQKTRRKRVSYAGSYLLFSNAVLGGHVHLPNVH